MKLRELMSALVGADPESTVIFLENHADSDESDEVCEVIIPLLPWTYEHGQYRGDCYEVWYPGSPRDGFDEAARTDVVYKAQRVIVLSNGPTNLRYYGVV
jgi:hypothetical protein